MNQSNPFAISPNSSCPEGKTLFVESSDACDKAAKILCDDLSCISHISNREKDSGRPYGCYYNTVSEKLMFNEAGSRTLNDGTLNSICQELAGTNSIVLNSQSDIGLPVAAGYHKNSLRHAVITLHAKFREQVSRERSY